MTARLYPTQRVRTHWVHVSDGRTVDLPGVVTDSLVTRWSDRLVTVRLDGGCVFTMRRSDVFAS